MRVNEMIAMLPASEDQDSMNSALAMHGSDSPEYRRAWRRQYRASNRRVDYYPDRAASKALDEAVSNGWARSYNEAISKALVFWRDWQIGEFEDYEQ